MGGRRRGEGRTANGETRTGYCRRGGGGSYRSSGSCGGHCLSETVKGGACPLLIVSRQRVHDCGVDVAHGLVLLFGIAREQSNGRPCR